MITYTGRMKYQVFVSGAPNSRDEFGPDARDAYFTSRSGVSGGGADQRSGGARRGGADLRSGIENGGGAANSHQGGRADENHGMHYGGDGAAFAGHGGTPVLRRFPPVVQFLTDVDPYVQNELQSLCVKAHRQGKNVQDVCQELYIYARSIGYILTLGVQEVFSSQMPSFPHQTVQSALIMVDVKRITSPNGYHEGRVAV